ncbi:GAF domain-containing protein [Paenibacillus sp. MBLB4367]|uniref:GAF domain-containing protein n=1 Tax=Paenibacillus sp. MBLB4367 TaxID=3384767 RepID=UPI0039083516
MENDRANVSGELDAIRLLTASDVTALAWVESGQKRIRWSHMSGNDNERYKHIAHRSNQGIAGTVVRTGRSVKSDTSDAALAKVCRDDPLMIAEKLNAVMAAPIVRQGEVQGVLLAGKRSGNAYSSANMEQLVQAGRRLASLLFGGELTNG